VALVVLALALAYGLKRWYSHAGAESLAWVLAPTAWLVGAIYRAPFYFSPGYGWVSPGLDFAIVPACAGINFLVVVLGAFICGILPQARTLAARARWFLVGAAAAYAVTLLANTVRIAIAVWLKDHPLGVDAAQVHRIEGSVVYLAFLLGFYALAQRQATRHA
jgi:exosortase K